MAIPKIALNVSATRLGDDAFASGVARLKRLGAGFEGHPRRCCEPSWRSLGTEIVAEGVETKDVADHVTRLGVDTHQGYFFGKPLPFDAVANWIDIHSPRTRSA